ncbi:ATP phosphoribosyltransferase regulatory subunit [Lachnospiraceae bacterium NK3A20]|nr:ATP phosphoribosyltransferase regulatory subunit [Lachnospiraceae bacterium NK3A20]
MSKGKSQKLLHTPEGVWDHYGRDYAEYEAVQRLISDTFRSYGYEAVRTPTFEFFDVFSKEIGTIPSNELYKFFDKDGHTMVLRPDFTPSVARCAAKYYMEETKPLRFCYEGSAFTNNSNLQGKLKESTQLGAELVNERSVYADAEMLAMLIRSLLSAGLSNFQITVGNVEYFKGICDAAGIDDDMEEELREYLSGKNYYAAETLLKGGRVLPLYREQFLKIADFMKNDEDLKEVQQTAPNERAASALQRLIDVYRVLRLYGVERYVSFDLSLLSKYQYYTGIIFKAYTYGVGDAVATGGRYDTLLSQFGKDAPAIGFMIRLETLIEALRAQQIGIQVPDAPVTIVWNETNFEEKLKEAEALRREGSRVVLAQEDTTCRI